MMLFGLVGAGLSYRSMREQRLLHEPLRVFRLDPSSASAWQFAPLRLYQNGPHAVVFSITAPDAATSALPDSNAFGGTLDIVIEDPQGNVKLKLNAMQQKAQVGGLKSPYRERKLGKLSLKYIAALTASMPANES